MPSRTMPIPARTRTARRSPACTLSWCRPSTRSTRTIMPKLLLFSELRNEGVLYTRRHVDRLEAEGKFPKRVPVGDARVAWVAQEVRDWIEKRINARERA